MYSCYHLVTAIHLITVLIQIQMLQPITNGICRGNASHYKHSFRITICSNKNNGDNSTFLAIFKKWNNFYDFLFASVGEKSLPKGSTIIRTNMFKENVSLKSHHN